jgi:deoxyribose-phosphate aldolase
LTGNWQALYDEVCEMRQTCGEARMKTILATGELGPLWHVAMASKVCMMAGADFIKTSTGKESVNATLEVSLVMTRAIEHYENYTGYFKPYGSRPAGAGWLALMKEELGDEWLHPALFRIGASSLLGDIERQLSHHVTGHYAARHLMPMG